MRPSLFVFARFRWHITVTVFSILVFGFSTGALTAPVPVLKRQEDLPGGRRTYAAYQISGGVGGTAESEAAAVIFAPFHGVELATVPYDVFERLLMMWEDIDYANNVAFPTALQRARSAASAAASTVTRSSSSSSSSGGGGSGSGSGEAQGREAYEALIVGKTKNGVLLQTMRFLILQIKLARYRADGQDIWEEEDELVDIADLLQAAIQEDSANMGQVSMPVKLDFNDEPS